MASGVAGLSFQALSGQPQGFRDVVAAGSGQSTATALANYSAMLYSSSSDGTTALKLPAGYLGAFIIVHNKSTATGALTVYPFLGGTVNGQSANSGYAIAVGATTIFYCRAASTWVTLSSAGGGSGSGTQSGNFSTTGSITSADATSPAFITPSGKSNTGTYTVFGKTSGRTVLTTADATGQIVTISPAAQTVGAVTLTTPDFAGVNDTFAFITKAQTLSNKTLDVTNINQDFKMLASQAFTSNGTLTNLTGLSWAVAASGTYYFDCMVPLVAYTANGGLQMAFKLTTATLTSINLRVYKTTDTDNTGAVSTSFTTTTDQATWLNQTTGAFTNLRVTGSFTVGTGGSIAMQAAQNTSHPDTTTFSGIAVTMVRTA